jgi:hypothetical protein
MNTRRRPIVNYRFMLILAIIVGIVGVALLLLPDFELIVLILTLAVLGGLIGGTHGYEELDRQRLTHGYKSAFEWLLLVLLAAFGLIELSRWFGVIKGTVVFMNEHWPGLIISVMCILIGISGFQRKMVEGSA